MSRIHNFSAGPGVLPESVVRQAQADLWNHSESGIGIVECSHRSGQFDAVIERAKQRLSSLLGLDEDQEVLFLHGGARTQFFMAPMNLLRGGRATYLDTGTWSDGALIEAQRFGQVDVPFSSRTSVPDPDDWGALPDGTRYLHYTSNNTVAGTEYGYRPDSGEAWLFCDMSSNFLSRPVDGSKFDLIYAGAQKNVGPAGTTVVILRKSLLEHCDPDLPKMLQYGIHTAKGSMYNTPCTFSIYVIERVTAWLVENGGIEAMEARNLRQADKVYGQIDGTDFWQGKVAHNSRSRMNVTFTTGQDPLDTLFWQSAAEEGLSGLKGHRSVGGLRASLYNAQTDEAVDALVDFMKHFETTHG